MGEGGLGHNKGEVPRVSEAERWNSFRAFAERNSGMSEVALIRAFLDENPFRTGFVLKDWIKEVFPDFDQNILVQELLSYRDGLSPDDKKALIETILAYLPTLSGLTDATAGLLIHAHRDCYTSAEKAVATSVTSFSDIQNKHIEQAVRRSLPLLEQLAGTVNQNVVDMPSEMKRSVLPPHTFPENLRESIPYNDRRALVTFLSLVPVYQYLQRVQELPYHPFNQDDDAKTLYARFNYHMEVGAFDQVKDMHKELLDIYRSAVEGRMQIVNVGGEGGLSLLPDDDTSQ